MTKRPPEMVALERHDEPLGVCFMDQCEDGTWVNADDAIAAIRSLRVKLFRERARFYGERARTMRAVAVFCQSEKLMVESGRDELRHGRFNRLADAIERGER